MPAERSKVSASELKYQHGIEGILQMLETLHLMSAPHDGDDIKAQFFVHLAFLDISIGSYGKIPHLAPGNSLFGLLVFLAGAGLHLYNHQRVAIGSIGKNVEVTPPYLCLLYTSPSPRDRQKSRMPSSA